MFTERLRHYRTIKGLSVSALAHQIGVSNSVYLEIEAGRKRPSQHELISIADALEINVYVLFACRGSDSVQFRHAAFRKNADLGKSKQQKIIAEIEDKLRNVITLHGIIGKAAVPTPPKCNTLQYSDNADDNARRLREHLCIAPCGSVSSLVDIVENNGILLCECSTEERKISGLNGYVDNIPYIAYRSDMSTQRIRSTIAHELAHLMFKWPYNLAPKKEEYAATAISGSFFAN